MVSAPTPLFDGRPAFRSICCSNKDLVSEFVQPAAFALAEAVEDVAGSDSKASGGARLSDLGMIGSRAP